MGKREAFGSPLRALTLLGIEVRETTDVPTLRRDDH